LLLLVVTRYQGGIRICTPQCIPHLCRLVKEPFWRYKWAPMKTAKVAQSKNNPSQETVEPKKDRFQISFDLKEDGSPDFESMQGRTKDRIKEFLANEKVRAEFGPKTADAPAVQIQIITPAMVAGLYGMLGAIEGMMFPWFFKGMNPVLARQVFTYTEKEVALLNDPTARVLNKYLPEWLIKYQDEIAMANLLLMMGIAKVNMAIMLSKQSGAQQETPPATEGKKGENTEGKQAQV